MMINADLPALALFTAGAAAVIQHIDMEDPPSKDSLEKEYSPWEEKAARLLPFLY